MGSKLQGYNCKEKGCLMFVPWTLHCVPDNCGQEVCGQNIYLHFLLQYLSTGLSLLLMITIFGKLVHEYLRKYNLINTKEGFMSVPLSDNLSINL